MSLSQSQFGKTLRTATSAATMTALAVGMGASAYVANSTKPAPEGNWVANGAIEQHEAQQTRASKPANVPSWNRNLSQQFPEFKDFSTKPEGALNTHVLVINQQNQPKVLTAQQAVNRAQDKDPANNTWWVGYK